ncbi:Aminoacyl tRNA synthase complex-interacting multifunctional protein 1 [Dissostichus eleginoides]|uniref:Aminoacyl tRNA synthase complex-interacting multifunctional protein 1 n=1 Tax=Dissostichus eleginoides TaxID=100907 RepID=A0AAD9BQX3_DISEL|nr:Aminoacyl tRNA synthase complex-interacting multifunctional protein 1 [Dissostichus eleginoides]
MADDIKADNMQNRMAVVLCNLKPAKRRGVAEPGDRVTVQGFPGDPDPELTSQVWEQIQAYLCTDGQCVATYKGAAFEIAGKGVCKAQSMSISEIKQTIRAAPKKLSANPCRQTSHNML